MLAPIEGTMSVPVDPEWQSRMRDIFLDEAESLVDDLESSLLSLEARPADEELINTAFRAAHTIKGSAASVGCNAISAFTHELESALESVRSKRNSLDHSSCTALLESVDLLRAFLKSARERSSEPDPSPCVARLKDVFGRPGESQCDLTCSKLPLGLGDEACQQQAASESHDPDAVAKTYEVSFSLPEDAFAHGLDPLALLVALAEEGSILRTHPLDDHLPRLEDMDPTTCYLGFKSVIATARTESDLRAVFEFCPEGCFIEIKPLEEPTDTAKCEISAGATETRPDGTWKRLGEILVEDKVVGKDEIEKALAKQQALSGLRTQGDDQTIRVKQSRVDSLIDLVGELVTARNALLHLQHTVDTQYQIPALSRAMKDTSSSINRIVAQLQSDMLSLRMVPLRTAFQRLPRVVRDVSSRQDKAICLHVAGEDIEVDKTVADAIVDPMIHLVRNAADHGIESRAERLAAGKTGQGHIWISAHGEGSGVVIEVRDDGRGIDPSALRKAAVERGLVERDAAEVLSDDEALGLIFAAGLSTAAQVSDLSGRGVGMDIVRRNIARVGGTVSVSSRLGAGTLFTLQLPSTISITRVLLVSCAGQVLALPTDSVISTTAVARGSCATVCQQPVITMHGELIGLGVLSDVLGLQAAVAESQGDCSDIWLIVVIQALGQKVALAVDSVEQAQEVLVKPVSSYLTGGGLVTGASVMGDGRVALVLDPAGLVRIASERGPAHSTANTKMEESDAYQGACG